MATWTMDFTSGTGRTTSTDRSAEEVINTMISADRYLRGRTRALRRRVMDMRRELAWNRICWAMIGYGVAVLIHDAVGLW